MIPPSGERVPELNARAIRQILLPFVLNPVEQSPACLLDKIQYVLKALMSSEVRIGNLLGSRGKPFAVLHEQAQLMTVLGRALSLQYREIRPVHRQNVVKLLEIL